MLFKEFINSDKTYCKISKSSPAIRQLCCEPHYTKYTSGQIVTDFEPQAHGLSFVTLDNIISALRYGDTYTEFDFTKNKITKHLAHDEIYTRPSALGEYYAYRLLVGKQYSLDEPVINMRIMLAASNLSIATTLGNEQNFSKIRNHYNELGLNEGLKIWEKARLYFRCAKEAGKNDLQAAKIVKKIIEQELDKYPEPLPIQDTSEKQKFCARGDRFD